MPPKFILHIPAYNVAGSVTQVLEAIPPAALERFYQVLIIDNGSRDGTREILETWARRRGDPRFRLFFNERNYSLGGSTIIALREAIAAGGDFMVCLHSDGQADPRALPEFLARAKPEIDFVLGNRLADRKLSRGYSLPRWWGNRFFAWLQNRIVRQELGDIGAYIAFNLSTVRRLPYWTIPHDMAYQPLLILAASKAGKIRVADFPISWGSAENSNVRPLRYSLVHFVRLMGLLLGHVPKQAAELADFRAREVDWKSGSAPTTVS